MDKNLYVASSPIDFAQADELLAKKAAFGSDIDLTQYDNNNDIHVNSTDELAKEDKAKLEKVGVDLTEKTRSASYVQVDNKAVEANVKPNTPLVLMSTGAAAKKYPELVKKYWWKAVKPDTDKYTAVTALEEEQGYFIWVQAGKKISVPLQACVFINHENQMQRVHNVVIIEEGAELNIISGCSSSEHVTEGVHLGISEMFVEKNAKLSFTMIHEWGENVKVRPRTVTIVDEGGQYVSNYFCMNKVKDIQMYPTVRLRGVGAVARLNSVLVAPEGSYLDIGGKTIHEVMGTRSEIVTRSISTGGIIINRGNLTGMAEEIKAHLECHGLMLAKQGQILAIPELDAHVGNAELSHEAAVGRIAPEEIEYLMARGMDEDEATATIVRGFLNVNIEGLPQSLVKKIEETLDTFKVNKGM
ncbi:MAG: SufD family Fe-S cluster assembly protein [Phascolarctobacterium sp.]|nr:SufD family Fe-S cluster assembly protein [Phascolarctobacterium sp.]